MSEDKKTKEYVVIAPHTSNVKVKQPDYEVGAVVELTDEQARKRVNKVRLKDAHDATDGRTLKGKYDSLKAKYDQLNGKYEALKAQMVKAGK